MSTTSQIVWESLLIGRIAPAWSAASPEGERSDGLALRAACHRLG